jgi:hypothetical protein
MTNNDFTVYDTVRASELEPSGDSIAFTPVGGKVQEVMLTTKVVDSGDSILVTGDSYMSGGSETYILNADHEVDLWTV